MARRKSLTKVKPEDFSPYQRPALFGPNGDKKTRCIVAFFEKHGTRYFPGDTAQEICEACLHILHERHNTKSGNWYKCNQMVRDLKQEIRKNEKPDHPEEKIDDLPKSLRETCTKLWKDWHYKNNNLMKALSLANDVVRALKEKDPVLAYKIMCARRDYEYEGFEIIPLGSTRRKP